MLNIVLTSYLVTEKKIYMWNSYHYLCYLKNNEFLLRHFDDRNSVRTPQAISIPDFLKVIFALFGN